MIVKNYILTNQVQKSILTSWHALIVRKTICIKNMHVILSCSNSIKQKRIGLLSQKYSIKSKYQQKIPFIDVHKELQYNKDERYYMIDRDIIYELIV